MPLPQDNDYRPTMLSFEKHDDNKVLLLVEHPDGESCELGTFTWAQMTDFARRILEAVVEKKTEG